MSSNGGPRKVFGQTMHRKGGRTNYQRQFGGGGGRAKSIYINDSRNEESEAARQAARRRLRQEQGEAIDAKFGYHRLEDKAMLAGGSDNKNDEVIVERRGWLFHMLPTTVRKIKASCSMLHFPFLFLHVYP